MLAVHFGRRRGLNERHHFLLPTLFDPGRWQSPILRLSLWICTFTEKKNKNKIGCGSLNLHDESDCECEIASPQKTFFQQLSKPLTHVVTVVKPSPTQTCTTSVTSPEPAELHQSGRCSLDGWKSTRQAVHQHPKPTIDSQTLERGTKIQEKEEEVV